MFQESLSWGRCGNGAFVGGVTYNLFKNYFETYILPHLPPNSIVIIDNARYHRCYVPGTFVPTSAANKTQLIDFLKSLKKKASMKDTKKDLLKRAKVYKDDIKTELQIIAERSGHQLLYLPPYHPELNPIEYAWGRIKRNVAEAASYNIDLICNEILPQAFSTVTSSILNKFFSHIRKYEDHYRNITGEEKQLLISQQDDEETENSDPNADSDDESSYSQASSDASVLSSSEVLDDED